MTLTAPTEKVASSDTLRLIPVKVKFALAVFGLAILGLISYGIGTNHGTPHVLTGRAYVGQGVATVKVGGWAYGFGVSPNAMTWYDANGSSHDGGIPPCLQHPGQYAWLRFQYANASGPDGSTWRDVTWVQCIQHG